MNLSKLQIIVLIAKYKKVTDVANVMGIKQPTVTFHMKSLEEEFGVQLFEMRTGKVLLTDAGTALLHYASKIQALTQETFRVMKEYRNMGKGSLTIGASYVPGTYVVPGLIHQFSTAYPGIKFQLLIKPAPVIRTMLLEHSLDVGFISTQPFDEERLHQLHICDDELVVVFAPSHPLASLTKLEPHMIANENFIYHGTNSTTRQMTEQWANKYNINLQVSMELDSLEAIKRAVMLGNGISFVSRIAVEDDVNRGSLGMIPIPGSLDNRSIYVCYHRERWRSAQLQAFLSTVS